MIIWWTCFLFFLWIGFSFRFFQSIGTSPEMRLPWKILISGLAKTLVVGSNIEGRSSTPVYFASFVILLLLLLIVDRLLTGNGSLQFIPNYGIFSGRQRSKVFVESCCFHVMFNWTTIIFNQFMNVIFVFQFTI